MKLKGHQSKSGHDLRRGTRMSAPEAETQAEVSLSVQKRKTREAEELL
jgi:hypothetical protein